MTAELTGLALMHEANDQPIQPYAAPDDMLAETAEGRQPLVSVNNAVIVNSRQ